MELNKIHKTVFFFGVIISTIIVSYLISAFFSIFNDGPILSEVVKSYSIFKLFILGVIIGPFFETLIFQAAIIEFFLYHLKAKYIIIPIFFSGVIFGSIHFMNTYNFVYMFAAIIMGFWFASVYILTKKRGEGNLNPLIITFICHLATNLIYFFTEMPS